MNTKDMYFKRLKFLHTLLGLVIITGYLTSYTLLTHLYPDTYFDRAVVDVLLDSSNVLLLLTATANLLLGAYMVAVRGSRRSLQMAGSMLVILSGLSAVWIVFEHLPSMSSGDLSVALLPVGALLAGLAAHLFCNLRVLNPKTRLVIDTSDRETGTVKWFNISKGFGFITRDQGEDVFVHYRAIRGEGHRTLAEGQRVEFVVTEKEKGLRAEDVVSAPP